MKSATSDAAVVLEMIGLSVSGSPMLPMMTSFCGFRSPRRTVLMQRAAKPSTSNGNPKTNARTNLTIGEHSEFKGCRSQLEAEQSGRESYPSQDHFFSITSFLTES